MSGPLKRSAIVKAVEGLKRAITAWENLSITGAPAVLWHGVQRKQVSQEVEEAAAALFELVDRIDIEPDAYPLVLAIDAFDDAFFAWADKFRTAADPPDPSGTPEVWNAFEVVTKELTLRTYKLPEPIGTLINLKPPCTLEKIAKMYGWYDGNGSPDTGKVQEEITAPGTHYEPADWVHPSKVRFAAEMAAKWEERANRIGKSRAGGQDRPQPVAKRESPESIEDLIRSGTNSAQICKMKHTTKAYVQAVAAELGLPLDGNVVADVLRKGRADTDEERDIVEKAEVMRVQALNSHEELGADIPARVLAMAADGVKPGDIAKALKDCDPNLNYQRVGKIIRDAELAETK